MVHVEVHAPMEPSEPEVPIETKMHDEALDPMGHPPSPED